MILPRDHQADHAQFAEREAPSTASYPPAFLEYVFYGSLTYAYLGQVWGIVIPAVGGVILLLNAVACLLSVAAQSLRSYRPVALAFCTGILVIVLQLLFHSLTTQAFSEGLGIVMWLELLIIIQSLSLRPGFLHRFALVALAIGISCLPYLDLRRVGGIVRAWASGTGLSNPNVLGQWFGFCFVYLLFLSIQSQRSFLKTVFGAAAVGCLYVVTLSVSRAPLVGIALACIVGFRHMLKRSFLPLVLFAVVVCLVYISGVFDEEISQYTSRGVEETGRGRLWPAALARILDSPWIGRGLGDTRIPPTWAKGLWHNPHNSFLYLALAAGVFPLICYLQYLARVAIGCLYLMQRVPVGEAALLPPLFVFALFEMVVDHYAFMSPWTIVVCCLTASINYNNACRGPMISERTV